MCTKLGIWGLAKRELDWENFKQFKTDNKSVKFIQDVYPNKEWKAEEVTFICDCVGGIRGKMCLHSVAQYYRMGKMNKPSLIPENQRWINDLYVFVSIKFFHVQDSYIMFCNGYYCLQKNIALLTILHLIFVYEFAPNIFSFCI